MNFMEETGLPMLVEGIERSPLRGLRVVLVDSNDLITQGVHCCLERAGAKVFTQKAQEGRIAEAVLALRPDVAILDDQPQNVSAIATIRAIWPTAAIILIGVLDTPLSAERASAVGATAVVLKSQPLSALIAEAKRFRPAPGAVDEVLGRFSGVGTDLAQTEVAELLSQRQLDILRGVIKGMNVRQIGKEHGISYKTVNNHLTSIYRRLGAQNLTQAIIIASRRGLIEIE